MDVSYTFHIAGVDHRQAADLLARRFFDKMKFHHGMCLSYEREGRAPSSEPPPFLPVAEHNDRQMVSVVTLTRELGEISSFVTSVCRTFASVSAVWWRVEELEDYQYSLCCCYYRSTLQRVAYATGEFRALDSQFDELLPVNLEALLAEAAGAHSARFDAELNQVFFTNRPVEVPQSAWMGNNKQTCTTT